MANHFGKTAKVFAKNLGKRVKRVALGRESAMEAIGNVAEESKRLGKVARDTKGTHRHAAHYVEKGRRAFNNKRYERAEEYFRRALNHDPTYALAYTYQGDALYKMDQVNKALYAWSKAVEVDPGSDAAAKAQKKLSRMRAKSVGLVDELEERVQGPPR